MYVWTNDGLKTSMIPTLVQNTRCGVGFLGNDACRCVLHLLVTCPLYGTQTCPHLPCVEHASHINHLKAKSIFVSLLPLDVQCRAKSRDGICLLYKWADTALWFCSTDIFFCFCKKRHCTVYAVTWKSWILIDIIKFRFAASRLVHHSWI